MALFDGWKTLDGFEFHVIIAAVLMTAAIYFGLNIFIALAINTIGWYALEAFQGIRDDKGANPFSGKWGWRKRFELIAPVVTGFVVTGVAYALQSGMV